MNEWRKRPLDLGDLPEGRGCFLGGGGGGGAPAQTTTVQKSDPWSGQQDYLTDVFKQAQTQADAPMEFYSGQTFAQPSAETNIALNAQTQRAMMGSPLTGAAQNQLTKTMAGDYLSAGNPYFSQMADSVYNQVAPRVNANFSKAGRYGSGAHQGTLASAMTDTLGQLAYQNYGDERTKQLQGMMFAPQMAQQDYFDIAKLAETGAAREDLSQQKINEDIARFNFGQQEPWQRLNAYANLVQGHYGGTSQGTGTQTMPPRSIGAGMLGGAAAGGGLGYLLGPSLGLSSGMSGLGGAGLGGLMGLL